MFGLWGRRTEPEAETSGVIEMKGTTPQVQTRKQWKGFWPASEPSTSQQMEPLKSGEGNSPLSQPSILRATVLSDAEAIACAPSEIQCQWSGVQPAENLGAAQLADQDDSDDQEFYEVQMTMKIPKPKKSKPDSQEHDAQLDEMQKELHTTQLQLQKVKRAFDTKVRENKDLVALVKELTESRSQLTAYKAIQGERFEDLQQEYVRVLRIVELSRAISKENIQKTSETTQRLNQVEEQLSRQRLVNQQTKERLARQKIDNMELREKLSMLERLDLLAFRRESACMVKFQQLHLKESY